VNCICPDGWTRLWRRGCAVSGPGGSVSRWPRHNRSTDGTSGRDRRGGVVSASDNGVRHRFA
jgi:hypothetical protein